MDLTELATAITELLAPAVPFLKKTGEVAAEEAAKHLGQDVWDKSRDVWERLLPALGANNRANEALDELEDDTDDDDLRAQFRVQLKKLLKVDSELAGSLAPMLPDPARGGIHSAKQEGGGALAQGNGAVAAGGVAIGGDLSGSVMVNHIHAELHGDGAIAQGEGAVAAGKGGIAVGGDVHGTIVTGRKDA